MRRSIPVALLLAIIAVLAPVPAAARNPNQAQPLPIGTGARFLPPTTSLYLAADPLSVQWEFISRLAGFYLSSPEVDEAQRRFNRSAGMSPQEIVDGIRSWIGGELFLAIPSAEELRRVQGDADDSGGCDPPGMLIGAPIRDVSAFAGFVQKVDAQLGTSHIDLGASGGEIFEVGRSAAGPLFYAAVRDNVALLSTGRQLLVEAIGRAPADSLATSPAFGTALGRLGAGSLVFLFTQYDAQALGFRGGGLGQQQPASWLAGALRLATDTVRVDVTADIASENLRPAARALLAKSANPVKSAGIVPSNTAFFVSWDNVKLLWDAIVEAIWPDPSGYEQFRQDAIQATGLDPQDDIVGWMTGELGYFVAPSQGTGGPLGNVGLGAVLEARDRVLVREKLDKIIASITLLARPTEQPSTQEIAGLPFYRIPVYGDTAIYLGLADNWVVLASSAGLAADVVAGVRAPGGLAGMDEYRAMRAALPDPVQFVGYVDLPQLVAITTTAIRASGGNADELDPWTRPIRSVGLAVNTTAARLDAGLSAHVVVPSEPLARLVPPRAEPRRLPAIIDASKHGGAWWGPDEDPTAPGRFGSPEIPSRGEALVSLLRNQVGLSVERMARPGEQVEFGSRRFSPTSLSGQRLAVRIGSAGTYTEEETAAYQAYVRCGGALLLISDGKSPGDVDELAAAFGMQAAGTAPPDAIVNWYGGIDLPPLTAAGGTGLLDWDEYTTPIAYYADDTYLDLDGDRRPSPEEPTGSPAAAVARYGWGRVAFVGTSALLDQIDHPLTTTLLQFLVPDAPWPEQP